MDFDVGIVGYGPVGATLGNLLGMAGISTVIFERESSVYHAPRAGHFDDEVMRVWQTVGLADAIEPTLRINPGMRFVNAKGDTLINWPRPQEVSPQGWNASYRFHQPTLERILRQGIARFDHKVLLENEVQSFVESGDHVAVHSRDLRTGDEQTVRCRYVVGCDGGRSLVRRSMNSGMNDLQSDEKWLVVDVELTEDLPALGDFTIQYCDPARPVTYARGVGGHRRWELMLVEGDDPATIAQEDSVWRLLKPWIAPTQARIERATVYNFHALVTRGWRDGRLILAGDSAHQMPPFLGQGMCAGIRDASNLAWKLAAVLQRRAPEALLDTYESERSPHVRKYIEQAIRLGSLIQIKDPAEARRRDEMFRNDPEVMKSIKPALGSGLHGANGAPAGELAPQPRLADGRRMDDAVGLKFALLSTRQFFDMLPAATVETLQANDVVLLVGEGLDYLHALGAQAAIVRPDRYLLGAATKISDMETLVSRLPFSSRIGHAA